MSYGFITFGGNSHGIFIFLGFIDLRCEQNADNNENVSVFFAEFNLGCLKLNCLKR